MSEIPLEYEDWYDLGREIRRQLYSYKEKGINLESIVIIVDQSMYDILYDSYALEEDEEIEEYLGHELVNVKSNYIPRPIVTTKNVCSMV